MLTARISSVLRNKKCCLNLEISAIFRMFKLSYLLYESVCNTIRQLLEYMGSAFKDSESAPHILK